MTENTKITADHFRRSALVYVRQSSTSQVEHNRESTELQYKLVERALDLGWKREQVEIIDQDLGVSGAGLVERAGFDYMTAQVALGRAGIILVARSRVLLAITRNGIDCSTSVALPTLSLAITTASTIPASSMTDSDSDSKAPCLKLSCTSCALVSKQAFATKPPVANCAADCPSVLSGAKQRARSASIPMRPSLT